MAARYFSGGRRFAFCFFSVLILAHWCSASIFHRSFSSFLVDVASAEDGVQVQMSEILGRYENRVIGAAAVSREILALGEKNPDSVVLIGAQAAGVPQILPSLREAFLSRAEGILANHSSADVIPLKKFALMIFPSDDEVIRDLNVLIAFSERVEHLSAVGDVEQLAALRRESHSGRELKILEARLLNLVAVKSKSLLTKHDASGALTLLSSVDKAYRDKEVLDLAAQAVAGLERQENLGSWPFDRPGVMELATQIEEHDPGIRLALAQLFSRYIIQQLSEGDGEAAQRYFAEVITRRPDPNPANTDLRLKILLSANGERLRSFAQGRLSELESQNALSFLVRLRLLIFGYFGWFFPVMLFSSLALLVFAGFLVMTKRRIGFLSNLANISFLAEKPSPGYLTVTEKEDEYSKLLAYFGLTDSATENEIKSAYRKAMKEYHPDSQGASEESVERFRELKHAYERINEIRSSWFGLKK